MERGEAAAVWFLALRECRVDDAWQLWTREDLDVNVRDADGATALHYAAAKGNLALVKSLVHAGADTTAQTPSHETPLRRARFVGHVEVIQYLLECKEISNSLERHLGRNTTLVERTAAITSTEMDPFRETVRTASIHTSHAFIDAARRGDLKTVRSMLERGDVNKDAIHRTTGETAFAAALVASRMAVCTYLMTQCVCVHGPYVLDGNIVSAVMVAVQYKDAALVRELVTHSARLDVAITSTTETTCALAHAVALGAVDIVEVLLELEAPIPLRAVPKTLWHAWDRRFVGATRSLELVLALACWHRQRRLVCHLLATQPGLHDPIATSYPMITVLCFAVHQGDHAVLEALFAVGFKRLLTCPTWIDSRDYYPLKYSLFNDAVETLRFMIDHTPRSALAARSRQTHVMSLLELAVDVRATACVAYLLTTGLPLRRHHDSALCIAPNFDLLEQLLTAALPSNIDAFLRCVDRVIDGGWCAARVELLLARCCTLPWVTTEVLNLLLLYGCRKYTDVPTLSILLAYGANANARSANEEDAITLAARHDDGAPLVLCLLRHGADANVSSPNGESPLSLILRHQETRYQAERHDAIEQLVASGAVRSSHVA